MQPPPASCPSTELASQRKPVTFIVPSEAVTRLAVESAQLSDALITLIKVVGQVADKQSEPKILDWLSPYILAISGRLDAVQEVIRAIVEEQPDG